MSLCFMWSPRLSIFNRAYYFPWDEGIHNKKHENVGVFLWKPGIDHVLENHGHTEDKPGFALKIELRFSAEI